MQTKRACSIKLRDYLEDSKMGSFNNKISAEFNPPRKWVLERALSYKNENIDIKALEAVGLKCPAHRVTCKKGFTTDLASVPRIIWNVIAPWDIARAAIIHDLLYKSIRQYRWKFAKGLANEDYGVVIRAKKAADDVFLMAMLDADPPVAKWKIHSAHQAVALFGKWSIIPSEDNT